MAKITMDNGMQFYGTAKELREVFEEFGVKFNEEEASEEEVREAKRKVEREETRKEAEANVGKYIVFSETVGVRTAGKPYEITGVSSLFSETYLEYTSDTGRTSDVAFPTNKSHYSYEIVEKPPVKLQEGDLVRILKYVYGAKVGEIVEVSEANQFNVRYYHRDAYPNTFIANVKEVELVAPASARVDL